MKMRLQCGFITSWLGFTHLQMAQARLMSDLLAMRLGRPRLSWGSDFLTTHSADQLREQYIAGLRAADQGQISELLAFARS